MKNHLKPVTFLFILLIIFTDCTTEQPMVVNVINCKVASMHYCLGNKVSLLHKMNHSGTENDSLRYFTDSIFNLTFSISKHFQTRHFHTTIIMKSLDSKNTMIILDSVKEVVVIGTLLTNMTNAIGETKKYTKSDYTSFFNEYVINKLNSNVSLPGVHLDVIETSKIFNPIGNFGK